MLTYEAEVCEVAMLTFPLEPMLTVPVVIPVEMFKVPVVKFLKKSTVSDTFTEEIAFAMNRIKPAFTVETAEPRDKTVLTTWLVAMFTAVEVLVGLIVFATILVPHDASTDVPLLTKHCPDEPIELFTLIIPRMFVI